MRLMISLLILAFTSQANAQTPESTVAMNFTASAETFRAATDEYRAIWDKEGGRIVAAMERATGLRFEPGPIEVTVYEGVSYSGGGARPMFLRASSRSRRSAAPSFMNWPIDWLRGCRSRGIITS